VTTSASKMKLRISSVPLCAFLACRASYCEATTRNSCSSESLLRSSSPSATSAVVEGLRREVYTL
jgi:hypothetical protein